MLRHNRWAALSAALLAACSAGSPVRSVKPASQAQALSTSFASGSLIIPVDETYQTSAYAGGTPDSSHDGTLLAFGLVDKLLRAGVPVSWAVDDTKTSLASADVTVTVAPSSSKTAACSPASTCTNAAFKAGPFIVDSADVAAASTVIATWQASHYTNVFAAQAGFNAPVVRKLTAAPHIAVFNDGYEDIAFGYLNSAGIPDSTGQAWPTAACANLTGGCASWPDVLTEAQVAGTQGVDDGVLVNADGTSNYCELTSMHYANAGAGAQPQTEVVREVRRWLTGRHVHAFMECEAASTFENQTNGHFLTNNGITGNFAQAGGSTVLVPGVPFSQFSGTWTPSYGSSGYYTLPTGSSLDASTSLLVDYTPNGNKPVQDIWITGYLDGSSANGKVSYLGGHNYLGNGAINGTTASLPISSNPGTNGIRLFLDSLYESPCTESEGQPTVTLTKTASAIVNSSITYTIDYAVAGNGPALAAKVTDTLPAGMTGITPANGGTVSGQAVTWSLGNLSPGTSGSVSVTAAVNADGTYNNQAKITFTVGLNTVSVSSNTTTSVRDTTTRVAITAPAGGSTVSSSPSSISGTAEAGDTITQVTLDGQAICTNLSATGGTWSCPVTQVLSNAQHTAVADAADSAGNTAEATSTFTVAAPLAVTITAPADGSTVTTATPAVQGTGTPGAVIAVTLSGATQPACSGLTVDGSGTWSCTIPAPGLANSTYTATATATQGLSSAQATSTFTVDTGVPDAPVVSEPANGGDENGGGAGGATFSGTADPGDSVTVVVGGSTFCTVVADANTGAWTCSGALADGSYTATVTASDGLNDGPSTSVTFTLDSAAPTVSIESGPPSLSSSSNATFTVSSSDPAPSSGPGPYLCSLNGGPFQPCPMSGGQVVYSLSDGSYTLQVEATDAAGNVSAPASWSWSIDTTPPNAPVVVAPANGGFTDSSTPTVSGHGDVGSTVTVSIGGAVICTATVDATGNWSCQAPFLADGSYTVSAVATDAASNTSAATSDTFTVDTSAPDTTLTSHPAANSDSGDAQFEFTASDGSSTFQCSLDGANFSPCTTPQAYTNLPDGTHHFEVRAVDEAGNVDPTPASYTWNIDTVAPAAPTFTTPTQGSDLATNMPTVSGTSEPGATILLTIDDGTQVSVAADANGNWSYTVPAGQMSDGSHTVSATAQDAAGNQSTPAQVSFTTDTTKPTVSITTEPADPTSSAQATFAFSSSEEPNVSYVCALDPADPNNPSYAPCPNPVTFTALSAGRHTLFVEAIDRAGNTSTPASYSWTVEAATASLTVINPTDGEATNAPDVAVSGTDSSATVTVTLNGNAVAGCTDVPVTGGSWTCDAGALADGTYALVATDSGGATVSETFTVDTAPPTANFTSTPPATSNSSAATFGFTSSETGSTFTCSLDGAQPVPCTSPQSLTGLADGSHTFTVVATDSAGNASQPASYTWTIDTTAPIAPVLAAPGDGSAVATQTPTFSGTGEPGSTVTVSVDGSDVCTAEVEPDGSWSCTSTSTLAEGSHAVTVTSTDGGGSSSSSPGSFVVDVTPPDTSIVGHPSDPTSASSATFQFSSSEANVTYTCDLDDAGFAPCADPSTFTGLADGAHGIAVAAVDQAGNVDPSPATFDWTIAQGGGNPLTLQEPTSGESVSSSTPVFSGTGTPGDAIEVTVDGTSTCDTTVGADGHWSCVPGSALGEGQHSAVVTATSGGAADGTVGASFTVDTRPPSTFILSGPPATTASTSADFTFGSNETGVTYRCSLDGAPFAACPTPDALSGLGLGPHALEVEAVDAAGNVDPAPPTWSWDIVPVGGGSSSTGSTSTSSTGSSSGSTSSTSSTGATGTGSTTGATLTTSSTGNSGTSTASSGSSSASSSSTSGSGSASGAGSGSSGSSASLASTGTSGSGATAGSGGSAGAGGSSGGPPGLLAGGGCGCGAGSGSGGLFWAGLAFAVLGLRRRSRSGRGGRDVA